MAAVYVWSGCSSGVSLSPALVVWSEAVALPRGLNALVPPHCCLRVPCGTSHRWVSHGQHCWSFIACCSLFFLPVQEVTGCVSLKDATELSSSYLDCPPCIIIGSEKYGFALQMKQLRPESSGEFCCPHGPGAGPSSLSHTGDVLRTVESSTDGH